MRFLWQEILNIIDDIINWFDNLFDFNPNDRPRQLIPVRHDKGKPSRNINHHNFEENLLKMLLLFLTMLLLVLAGVNLVFDN